jgi:hypothetical protein
VWAVGSERFYFEGFVGQMPKLLNHPRLPHQNFAYFQSASKILKTSSIIKNTLNSPVTGLVSLNYGVVVVKLRFWAAEQFGRFLLRKVIVERPKHAAEIVQTKKINPRIRHVS